MTFSFGMSARVSLSGEFESSVEEESEEQAVRESDSARAEAARAVKRRMRMSFCVEGWSARRRKIVQKRCR